MDGFDVGSIGDSVGIKIVCLRHQYLKSVLQ